MHPLEIQYTAGNEAALATFGLMKAAAMTPNQQRLREMEMRNKARLNPDRPKGLDAVRAQMTPPAVGLGRSQSGLAPGAAMPVGGPGTAPGFQVGGGLPLETPAGEAAHNRAQMGIAPGGGPLWNQGAKPQGLDATMGAAQRAQQAQGGQVPLIPGRNVLGHLMLPWPG